ncbi:hypothetical protein LZ906_017160 (plasmid) [Paraclostridium ghonii]|uniref:hypothetical protein n=1 Tax=Paraclostridium ghonii TaxID=29358 RepID=UPI00303574A3|nr:hypothetical protein [Paeniclostridium ghonii]
MKFVPSKEYQAFTAQLSTVTRKGSFPNEDTGIKLLYELLKNGKENLLLIEQL